jgi:hypothetical protein
MLPKSCEFGRRRNIYTAAALLRQAGLSVKNIKGCPYEGYGRRFPPALSITFWTA